MSTYKVCVLLAVFAFGLVSAENCPDRPTKLDLDMVRLMGKWYEVEVFSNQPKHQNFWNKTCTTKTFSETEDGYLLEYHNLCQYNCGYYISYSGSRKPWTVIINRTKDSIIPKSGHGLQRFRHHVCLS